MKSLSAIAASTAPLLTTTVALAQSRNMMDGGGWHMGWMSGYGGIWGPMMKQARGNDGNIGIGMMETKGASADATPKMRMTQKRMDMMEMMIDQQGMMSGTKIADAIPKK